jgi:hypothetical protein
MIKKLKLFPIDYLLLASLVAIGYFLVAIPSIFAQSISLKSAKTSYEVGEGFPVSLSIDTGGKSINTISGTIRVGADAFQIFDLRYGNSIITLWVEKPAINASEGTITFTGGVPGGFTGTGGPLLNFAEKAKKMGSATIALEQVSVLLNDGLGTELKDLVLKPLTITAIPAVLKKIAPPAEKKEEEKKEQLFLLPDKDAPDEFIPIVSRDPRVADNNYFVSFFAVDKDTGIAFYEIEERPKIILRLTAAFNKPWMRAESPYVLRMQWLPTTVTVRAFDQAGNMREGNASKPAHPIFIGIILGAIAALLSIGYLIKRKSSSPPQSLKHRESKKMLFFAALFFAIFAFPSFAQAQATLLISPREGIYEVGELFSVLINVNTGGADINTAVAQLNFDNAKLEVESMGYSRSIFTLWTEELRFSNEGGTIRFSGGVPNPGFNGASGAIARITFRPKATGVASVVFLSGSVLANDGKGTNILDSMQGGVFTIRARSTKEMPAPAPSTTPSVEETKVEQKLSAPRITDWPAVLEEGVGLTVRGIGYPNTKVIVFFQHESEEPVAEQGLSVIDGRFQVTYGRLPSPGIYRIWAKSTDEQGAASSLSETVTSEVRAPLVFRIGTKAVSYATMVVTLLALLLLAIVIMVGGWLWFRRRQIDQGKEIGEAERELHRGFDKIKEGLSAYLGYLTENTDSSAAIKLREEKTRHELKEELRGIEEHIEKEIKDIELPRKHQK